MASSDKGSRGEGRTVRRGALKATAGCEGLEGRQMLTGGMGMGLPSFLGMAPFAQGGAPGGSTAQYGSRFAGSDRLDVLYNARQQSAAAGLPMGLGGGSSQATPFAGMGSQGLPGGPTGQTQGNTLGGQQAPSGLIGLAGNSQDVPWASSQDGTSNIPTPLDNFTFPFAGMGPGSTSTTPAATTSTTPNQAPPSLPTTIPADVQKAMDQLQTDQKKIPTTAKPTHAAIGAVLDDLDAILAGTLTGDAADARLKADRAAVLKSAGVDQALIDTIQADEQSLQDAIKAAQASATATTTSSTSTTTTTSSDTTSTATTTPTNLPFAPPFFAQGQGGTSGQTQVANQGPGGRGGFGPGMGGWFRR